jgi:hypothetical protein
VKPDVPEQGMVVLMSPRSWLAVRSVLVVIVAAGLAVDTWVHFDLASSYDGVKTSTLSQGDLFRVEGVLALLAAVALLVRPRRYTAAFAFLVSAGGTAAVLLYAHVDVGALGPVPNMYEPIWYPEKTLSVWAEGIAAATALVLLAAMQVHARRARLGGSPQDISRGRYGLGVS